MPEGFLTGLHSAGLTWAYVLPVAAVSVRLATFFVFNYPARRAAQRLALIQPVMAGHINAMRRKAAFGDQTSQELKSLNNHLRKIWKAQTWRMYLSLGQVPVFLAVMESIRRMSGSNQGLWAYLMDLASAIKNAVMKLFGATISAPAATTGGVPVDPTWASEGPFWCTDLSALDPTQVLPVAVPVVMLITIVVRNHTSQGEMLKLQRMVNKKVAYRRMVVHRMLLAGGACMGCITPYLPAGLLWYWFWSASAGLVSNVLMERFMPIALRLPPIRPFYEQKKSKSVS